MAGHRKYTMRFLMISLEVQVHPGASREAVRLLEDGTLDVRPRARAVESRANEALVRLLAERLGPRQREVRIARGCRSRHKLIEVELASRDELCARPRAD